MLVDMTGAEQGGWRNMDKIAIRMVLYEKYKKDRKAWELLNETGDSVRVDRRSLETGTGDRRCRRES